MEIIKQSKLAEVDDNMKQLLVIYFLVEIFVALSFLVKFKCLVTLQCHEALAFHRYEIQSGLHDPYEDCVSAMRLYKRLRAVDHQNKGIVASLATDYTQNITNRFDSWKAKELEKMTPDELYQISTSNYKCWCLDQCKNAVLGIDL